jgi:hypothetical protein
MAPQVENADQTNSSRLRRQAFPLRTKTSAQHLVGQMFGSNLCLAMFGSFWMRSLERFKPTAAVAILCPKLLLGQASFQKSRIKLDATFCVEHRMRGQDSGVRLRDG